MDHEQLEIKEYQYWSAHLHPNQSYLGKLYFWLKRDGAIDFMYITRDEREELFKAGKQVELALTDIFKPAIFNWAAFGNETSHCHVHLIPRYSSSRVFSEMEFLDKRWGKNYSPYDKDFKIPDKILLDIKTAIQARL